MFSLQGLQFYGLLSISGRTMCDLYLSQDIILPEDPMLILIVETRILDWDTITRFDKIKPYLKLLKLIFATEENRITGEEVVAELVRTDKIVS
jgi:hypothetical protein